MPMPENALCYAEGTGNRSAPGHGLAASAACFSIRAMSLSKTARQRFGHQRGRFGSPSGCTSGPSEEEQAQLATLAGNIDGNDMFVIPTPLEISELEQLLLDFGVLAGAA